MWFRLVRRLWLGALMLSCVGTSREVRAPLPLTDSASADAGRRAPRQLTTTDRTWGTTGPAVRRFDGSQSRRVVECVGCGWPSA